MPTQPKNIFITGGSGYVGSAVIRLASTAGHTITALSRSTTSDTLLTSIGATPIRGDLTSVDVLTTCAQQADAVIHIANILAGNTAADPTQSSATNEAALAAIVAGLKGTDKPLVMTSGSLKAAADPEGKETDEESAGWDSAHAFAWTSAPRSQVPVEAGVKVCYMRLAPWVYGRGGSGVALLMRQWISARAGIIVDGGRNKTSTVHVDDAAVAILLAVEKPEKSGGQEFNVTSQTDVEHGEIARAVCEGLGVECKSVTFEEAEKAMGAFFAMFLSVGNRASSAKARRELGWAPRAERGILEEIREGSYIALAEELTKGGKGA